MLRTFHVADNVSVSETKTPGVVAIAVGTDMALITEEQFKELCCLQYTVKFEPKPEEKTTEEF